jgi:hypothetical protein
MTETYGKRRFSEITRMGDDVAGPERETGRGRGQSIRPSSSARATASDLEWTWSFS